MGVLMLIAVIHAVEKGIRENTVLLNGKGMYVS